MAERTEEKAKSNRLDFWDGLCIFSLCLIELCSLYLVWSFAFRFPDDALVAIIAATFTVVVALIDCAAILNNKLNNMEYEAKHFMPDVKYKLDSTHSNVEEARSLLNRIDNRSVEMRVYRDVIKIMELHSEISQLRSQVTELKIKLLDYELDGEQKP